MRASWEYQNRSGFTAVTSAATSPIRSDARRRPTAHITGIVSVPHRAENERSPTSPVPKTCAHSHTST